MNFGRPISIVASEEGATVFDVMGNGGTQRTIGQQSIHSFYLPRNTVGRPPRVTVGYCR